MLCADAELVTTGEHEQAKKGHRDNSKAVYKSPEVHGRRQTASLHSCREYADFRMSSDGELQGVGMIIGTPSPTGRLVVLAPLEGGPAARAGVRPGDEVRVSVFRIHQAWFQ